VDLEIFEMDPKEVTTMSEGKDELITEADVARRIAEYLQLNGLANLEEAAARVGATRAPSRSNPIIAASRSSESAE
jgi:hypothetical protein